MQFHDTPRWSSSPERIHVRSNFETACVFEVTIFGGCQRKWWSEIQSIGHQDTRRMRRMGQFWSPSQVRSDVSQRVSTGPRHYRVKSFSQLVVCFYFNLWHQVLVPHSSFFFSLQQLRTLLSSSSPIALLNNVVQSASSYPSISRSRCRS